MSSTMEAVYVQQYGRYDSEGVVANVRAHVPSPEAGEVMVRVRCAALNPVDWKTMEGWLKPMYRPAFPYIPGHDFSGVVEAVGPSCRRFRVGDEVFGMADDGALAECVVVKEEQITRKTRGISWEEAAGLPLAGMTAVQAVNEAGVCSGGTLLVIGGSSSTGLIATQIAKSQGANVIATCSAANVDLVRRNGADRVIDRTTTDWCVDLADSKVDAVLDTVGEHDAYRRSKSVLRYTRTCPFVTFAEGATEKMGVLTVAQLSAVISLRRLLARPPFKWIWMRPDKEVGGMRLLEKLRDMVDIGAVRPVIDSVFDMKSVRDAFSRVHSGHSPGKVVIRISSGENADAAEVMEVEHAV